MIRVGESTVLCSGGGGEDLADDIVCAVVEEKQAGDTVWLVPGHCDPTFNLHDYFYLVQRPTGELSLDKAVITDVMLVDARGCQQ